jgi:hypothetical protein
MNTVKRQIIAVLLLPLVSACSTQNWYTGAQSAQQAHCMQGPYAEYEECMQQSTGDYNTYSKNREQLLKQDQGN